MLNGPVLVGTDLSRGADEALRQGARLAGDLGADLVVCHVVPDLSPVAMLFPQWRGPDPAVGEALAGKARHAIGRQIESVCGDAGRQPRVVLELGTAPTGLLTQAEAVGAGLIVVGPGRVAGDVVRHATVPVLVARPSPAGPVVGATDFSDLALPALHAAAGEARRREAALHLIHVLDLDAYSMLGPPTAALAYVEGRSAMALEGIDEFRAAAALRLDETHRPFDNAGTVSVVTGRAATAIVQYAETAAAEVVVVGTHGHSGLTRLTLGSTAARVLETAPCSVLIVRVAKAPA
jgi:nucleotide-binding universal stress UspA family protein